jgi:uncharacterized membrane protein
LFVGGLIAETAFLAALRRVEDFTLALRQAVSAYRTWDRMPTTPAMLLVWGFGLTLASSAGWLSAGWLQAKLMFVLALSAPHAIQSGALRRLACGSGRPRAQTVPALAIVISAVAIAVLAVTKPF